MICIQYRKKNIYGASMKKWSSHKVINPTEIIHSGSHTMDYDRKL